MQPVISLKNIDYTLFENFREAFAGKGTQLFLSGTADSHKEALKRMQALQKKYPPKVIPEDINLSDLINEMNT